MVTRWAAPAATRWAATPGGDATGGAGGDATGGDAGDGGGDFFEDDVDPGADTKVEKPELPPAEVYPRENPKPPGDVM
jgi:hypothetical protein